MNVAIYTLGCKLNQCESEGLADAFVSQGFRVVPASSQADLCIVNTCTVTTKAEQKARRMIRQFLQRENEPVVIVTGCYAQLDQDLIQAIDSRLFVIPLERKAHLLSFPSRLALMHAAGGSIRQAIESFLEESASREASVFDYSTVTFVYHARAFLKIEDGCDNACSYCRVTLARGKAVSLEAEKVLELCTQILESGYREIVLTGVNITAYRDRERDLAGLLSFLLERLDQRVRFRLSSLEPDMITDRLIEVCRDPRILPHFHIPVQSGSDAVLRIANRHYDRSEALEAIKRLTATKEDAFLAADIITGLPGEGDGEFEMTLDFLQEGGFSAVHVFPFSPRPGTELYRTGNRVPESVRDQRALLLRTWSTKASASFSERQRSRLCEAIIESVSAKTVRAVTDRYMKVELYGLPTSCLDGARRRLVRVRIDEQDPGKAHFLQFI